jgi:hypothetical protein
MVSLDYLQAVSRKAVRNSAQNHNSGRSDIANRKNSLHTTR